MAEPTPLDPLDPLALPLAGTQLIEASAGTGKTWTLAALVLRLVLGDGVARPLAPSQILVMSFTRAATRELRERIRARLAGAAAVFRGEVEPAPGDTLLATLQARTPGPPAAVARRLALAADAMDEAAVHTIDAWCQRMLREHAFASGSAFDETLVTDESGWRREAVRGWWREQVYPLAGETLAAVLAQWRDVDALEASLAPLLRLGEVRVVDTPSTSLAAEIEADRQALVALKAGWQERADVYEAWIDAQRQRKDKPLIGTKLNTRHVANWFQQLRAWAADPFVETPLLGKGTDRLVPGGLREAIKPEAQLEPPPEAAALKALLDALAARRPLAVTLRAQALVAVRARIAALKAASASLGFADVQQRLADALDEPARGASARELRERILAQFPVAMVDEFQDTSPLQLAIFERLYGLGHDDPARTLLLIGDPKQSIYGFRGADIHSYLRAARAVGPRRHVLGTNHRSTLALVEAVNTLFARAEAREAQPDGEGGAFRFERGALPFHPVAAAGRPERLLAGGQPVPALTLAFDARPAAVAEGQQRQAEACALRIVSLLVDAGAGFDHPQRGFRRLHPADCAVLVRNRHEAAAVRRALAARGLASVYLSDQDSVFASAEAGDVLRLLAAAAEPRDSRRLRAALATRLVGWPLARLRALADDDAVLERAVEGFAELQAAWQRHGVLPMLRLALHRWIEPSRWRAEGGERALTNLLHLAELLQQAAATLDGEPALLRWLAQQIEAARDGAAAAEDQVLRLESDAALVPVITVHKSKGLQYPLVFLPFVSAASAWRRPDHVVLAEDAGHRRLVLGPDDAALAQAQREAEREPLRLLYVALTRAEHALWLGAGTVVDADGASAWTASAFGWLVSGGRAPLGAADVAASLRALMAHWPQAELEPLWPGADEGQPAPPLRWADPQPARPLASPQAPPPRSPQRPWAVGSYSAFVRGLVSSTGPSELPPAHRGWRDDEPELLAGLARAAVEDPADGGGRPIQHRFVRGSEAGQFLHEQLEWLAGDGAARLDALAQAPEGCADWQRRCERAGHGADAMALAGWMAQVMRTPLPPLGASLAGLDQRWPELEFWLPTERLDAAAVDALCRRHVLPGQDRPPLPPRQLRGLLMGFADLVYGHDGRYGVVDHKSNALGDGDAAYGEEALAQAVLEHRYDVQGALYLVALHRLLRARLGAAYAPERQLQGAVFLFLRGITAPGAGAWRLAPVPALIDGLDALFAPAELRP